MTIMVIPQAEDIADKSQFESWEDKMKNVKAQLVAVSNSTSRNVSSNGRIVGLSVWSHKGLTLKKIRVGHQMVSYPPLPKL